MFWKIFIVPLVCTVFFGDEYRVFLDQPHDFEDKTWSYSPGGGGGPKVGDDFRPSDTLVVQRVSFQMVATWPDIPTNWSFYVHRTTLDHPVFNYAPEFDQFYRMIGASSVRDLGEWNGDPDLHLFEVTFDNIHLRLNRAPFYRGIYWFSPDGFIPNFPRQLLWWGTAGHDFIFGDSGWWRTVPFEWPGWMQLDDDPSDYAMRIEGHLLSDNVPPDVVLTDFELLTGELLDGELFDLRHTDTNRMTLLTRQQPARHNPRVKYIVRALSRIDDPDFIDLTIAQTLEANQGDAFLSLYNWRTEEYDPIRDYPLGRSENTIPIRGIPAADYINKDNEIELLVENVAVTRTTKLTTATESTINRIRFDLRRED